MRRMDLNELSKEAIVEAARVGSILSCRPLLPDHRLSCRQNCLLLSAGSEGYQVQSSRLTTQTSRTVLGAVAVFLGRFAKECFHVLFKFFTVFLDGFDGVGDFLQT